MSVMILPELNRANFSLEMCQAPINLLAIDFGPVSAWATAIVALIAVTISLASALLVLFKERIILNRFHPTLILECSNSGIFFLPLAKVDRTRRLRFRVTNIGNAPAKNVEVHVVSVVRRNPDKTTWSDVGNFLPAPVRWTHLDEVRKSELPSGIPAMLDFADLGPRNPGSVRSEESLLTLCTGMTSGELWRYPGATYRFDVLVTEAQGEQFRCYIEVSFSTYLNTIDPLEAIYAPPEASSSIQDGNLTISMKSVSRPLAESKWWCGLCSPPFPYPPCHCSPNATSQPASKTQAQSSRTVS